MSGIKVNQSCVVRYENNVPVEFTICQDYFNPPVVLSTAQVEEMRRSRPNPQTSEGARKLKLIEAVDFLAKVDDPVAQARDAWTSCALQIQNILHADTIARIERVRILSRGGIRLTPP